MAALSNYLEDAVIDHVLRNTALTSPTTVYVALFSADAGDLEANSIVNEVSGGSYARQAVTFGAPSGGSASNSAGVSFTDMPAGDVTHVAIMDASTAGNVLFHGALTTSRTLNAGDTFTLPTGDITATMD